MYGEFQMYRAEDGSLKIINHQPNFNDEITEEFSVEEVEAMVHDGVNVRRFSEVMHWAKENRQYGFC